MDRHPLLQPLYEIINTFDQRADGFDLHDLNAALTAARTAIGDLQGNVFKAAADELLAFEFQPWAQGSPWDTHFGPLVTLQKEDGGEAYIPDKAWLDAKSIAFWRDRAATAKHPLLSARYADLVWDMETAVDAGTKRDGKMGTVAASSYIEAAVLPGFDRMYAYQAAQRGLTLAIALNNSALRDKARAALLSLHKQSKADGTRWFDAYDILIGQPKSGLIEVERDGFIADLEAGLARCANEAVPASFDPHYVQGFAERLISHYRREKRQADEKRVHAVVARATEHFASLADAMLASSVLNDAMDSYRNAGLLGDAECVRRLQVEKVREANGQMASFRHEVTITFEQVEAFKAEIVVDDPALTLARIASNFLLKRDELEALVDRQEEIAPLQARITQTIMGEDYQVASVGSTEEDPFGRVLRQSIMALQLNTPWLSWAIEAAIERHKFELGHFVQWCNRAGLFGDGILLSAGLDAWLIGDDLKATHILIPQVERALRNLVDSVGCSPTKPDRRFKGAQAAVTMGEIIFNKDTVAAFGKGGPNLALHFAALYADPRGMNLRNELAHGLLDWRAMHNGTVMWIVHSLLLLGLWRRPSPDPSPEAASPGKADAPAPV